MYRIWISILWCLDRWTGCNWLTLSWRLCFFFFENFWKTSHLDLFKNCLNKFQVKDEILREGPLSRCLDGTLGFGSFLLATPHWALSCLTDRFPRKRGGGHEHHEPWNLDVYEEWDQPILLVGAFAAGKLKWPREAVGTWLQDIVTVVIGELNKSFSQIKRELERNHHDGVSIFFPR